MTSQETIRLLYVINSSWRVLPSLAGSAWPEVWRTLQDFLQQIIQTKTAQGKLLLIEGMIDALSEHPALAKHLFEVASTLPIPRVQTRGAEDPDRPSLEQGIAHMHEGLSRAASLLWTTWCHDTPDIVRTRRIVVGRSYVFETRIGPPGSDAPFHRTFLDSGLAGQDVSFDFLASNLLIRPVETPGSLTVSGNEARPGYGSRFSAGPQKLHSDGTKARVRVEILAPEPATHAELDVSVVVANTVVASERLEFGAFDENAPFAGAASSEDSAIPPFARKAEVSPDAFPVVPSDLRLEVTSAGNQFNLNVSTYDRWNPHPVPAHTDATTLGETILTRARNRLVELSTSYRADPDNGLELVDADRYLREFAAIGAELHEGLFSLPNEQPEDANLQTIATTIARTSTKQDSHMQIVAPEFPLPWGILYDGAYRRAQAADPAVQPDLSCFWGARFILARATRGAIGTGFDSRYLGGIGRAQARAVVSPVLDPIVADRQRQLLRSYREVLVAESPIENDRDFEHYVRSNSEDHLLYFFCHADAAHKYTKGMLRSTRLPDEQACIQIERDTVLTVSTLRNWRGDALPRHPLVFLNACSTTEGDTSHQSRLLHHFRNTWRARGFIGTDWKVPQLFADAFSRLVMKRFLGDRLSIGQALATATGEVLRKYRNPFPLIYALYCRPDLCVSARDVPTT